MKKLLDFIIRYKVLYIVYWTCHFVFSIHERIAFFGGTLLKHLPSAIISIGWKMISVYFVIYWLLPKFFYRKRYIAFVLCTLGSIIAGSILSAFTIQLYFHIGGRKLPPMLPIAASQAIDIAYISFIFLSVIILYNHFQKEREKVETELNFLRSQLNPHFLFNALNSIYFLIEEDKNTAIKTLLKFSGLMRYHLYECSGDRVELAQELSFLNDYIGMEELRNDDNLEVKVTHPDRIGHFLIAPFVLIPFVENAFKHVSRDTDSRNFIHISSNISEDKFVFVVANSFDQMEAEGKQHHGIGLQNVKRRLELVYPKTHELSLHHENGVFTVKLTLYADKTELRHRG